MIPTIDPQVKYRGTSSLRKLNADTLRSLEGAIVIQGADLEPVAIILPYATYLAIQQMAGRSAERSVETAGKALETPARRANVKAPLLKPKE